MPLVWKLLQVRLRRPLLATLFFKPLHRHVKDHADGRRIIRESMDVEVFQPQDASTWEAAYEQFSKLAPKSIKRRITSQPSERSFSTWVLSAPSSVISVVRSANSAKKYSERYRAYWSRPVGLLFC